MGVREFMFEIIVEDMAEVLYRHASGMTDAEYQEDQGKPRRAWRIPGRPFDSNPDVELCEWERDEYRFQARAVCEHFMQALDKLWWRPVSKGLPEPGKPVLVLNPDGAFDVDCHDPMLGWGSELQGYRDPQDGPTHWMPIPPIVEAVRGEDLGTKGA
jgi:hypothetical protein